MTEVVLEELNPNGNIQAVVEVDENVCFFYLVGDPETELGVRSVWVRNLVRAPDSLDRDRLLDGRPPLNPVQHCRHPQGAAVPQRDRLRIVWLPEGNGAALYEDDDVLAVIPPWSGSGGFHGYAKHCIGEGPLSWELAPDNALLPRIDAAANYWQMWDDETLWPSVQEDVLERIEAELGTHSNYYAIDGGHWPPKALVRIPRKQGVALVTLGVCLRPQPNVEMYTEDPKHWRRIELGAFLPNDWPEEDIEHIANYLSAQSELPWTKYTWFGPGHTIPCDSWRNKDFAFAVLSYDHSTAPTPNLGSQFGDPVRMLWFNPITEQERRKAIESSGNDLVLSLPERRWEDS